MTPALGRVSLKDGEFKAIMGYLVTSKPGYLVNLVRLCLKIQRTRKIYSGVWIKKKKAVVRGVLVWRGHMCPHQALPVRAGSTVNTSRAYSTCPSLENGPLMVPLP